MGFPGGSVGKESAFNAGDTVDESLIPGSGRFLGGGHGNPLQYSCLEDPMDRGARWATVHRVVKTWTQLKWLSTHTSNIFKAFIQLNSKKLNKPIKKYAEEHWIDSFPKKTYKQLIGTWKGAQCYYIREMQVKTALRFHLASVRMLLSKWQKKKKTGDSKCCWGCLKKKEPLYTVGGTVNWCSYYGK